MAATSASVIPASVRSRAFSVAASAIGLVAYFRPSALDSTERILQIQAEDRTLVIDPETRTRTIRSEDRANIIPGEF